MARFLSVTAVALIGLSGCGDSGLNPLGWFGGQNEETGEMLTDVTIVEVQDQRPRIPRVTDVQIDRTPGGAIIRATGLPGEQGWHSASLEPVEDGSDSILTLDFRAVPPGAETRISTVQSREIVVGYPISNLALRGVRTIRIVGATNIATVSR